MNVLFLTLSSFNSADDRGIYIDLIREFSNNGHNVFAVSPSADKDDKKSYVIESSGIKILKLKTNNTQKEKNKIIKGLSVLNTGRAFKNGIKKFFFDVKFDLVLYATPPVTFYDAVKYVKKRDNAMAYLMLKDIFPQNAVDIGMMQKSGVKGIVYKYFRSLEKKLYSLSDKIGCMSGANVKYLLEHNEMPENKAEVMPNSISVEDNTLSDEKKASIRKKYNIPSGKTVFVYGGNLGKPQGIDFLIDCLKDQMKNKRAFFVIVGDGTEYSKLERFIERYKPENIVLIKALEKNEYDTLISACDAGLIFLDYRFTIPNFPSRLLGYLQARLPVIAATDDSSDIGDVAQSGNFGFKCPSNSVRDFSKTVEKCLDADLKQYGENGFKYLCKNYSVNKSYEIIMRSVNEISVH